MMQYLSAMTLQAIIAIIEMLAFYVAYFAKQSRQSRLGVKTMVLGKGNKPLRLARFEVLLKALTICMPFVALFSIFDIFHLANQALSPVISWLGIMLVALGDFFFVASVITMSENWRAGIPSECHTSLVTHGIYRISRNPAFVGFDLMYIGLLLAFPNYLHLFFVLLALFMFDRQIRFEEIFLLKSFGREYRCYQQCVKRYVGRF